jgi:hypothetical protein
MFTSLEFYIQKGITHKAYTSLAVTPIWLHYTTNGLIAKAITEQQSLQAMLREHFHSMKLHSWLL